VGFGGGLKGHEACVVATDGTVTDGPYLASKEHLGGFAVVDVSNSVSLNTPAPSHPTGR
jgi:hypothetical protein